MNNNNTYIIHYQSVKTNISDYTFDINSSLFEQYPEGEVHNGKGLATIQMVKHSEMLELNVEISGEVELECDRCLDIFSEPFHWQSKVVVCFGEEPEGDDDVNFDLDNATESDDVIWLDDTTKQGQVLDLTQYIYESIILSLPINKVHSDISMCNQDMIKRFTIEQ